MKKRIKTMELLSSKRERIEEEIKETFPLIAKELQGIKLI